MVLRLRSLLIASIGVLLVTSCGSGGGGSSDEAKPYVDAMVKSMTAEEESPMNKEESRCFSEGFIDVVGLDKIKEAGTPKQFAEQSDDLQFKKLDLTRDQGGEIYDQFEECGVDLRATLLEELLSDDKMSAEAKNCIEKAVSDEKLREFFITLMVSGENALQKDKGSGKVMSDLMGCMMGDIGGAQ